MPTPKRREDQRLLTGRGRYLADQAPPGLLHAVLLRSPHAHADIVSVDIGAARGLPGVVAVLTAADAEADGIGPIPGGVAFARPDGTHPRTDRPVLAGWRCRFVGEPVVLVIAETPHQAQDAAEAIGVDYAGHEAVVTAAAALADGAPALWDDAPDNIGFVWQGGDAAAVDAAIAGAAHVTRLRCDISRVTAVSLEPRGAWAVVQPDGRLALTVSHQSPYALRNGLAGGVLNQAASDIRVITGDVGGAFGMKDGVHAETVLVGWAARRLGRPVRWLSDRGEAFLSDEQARDIGVDAALALDADGTFLGLRVRFDVNVGAYLSDRSLFLLNNIGGVAGVYRLPAIRAEARGVFTNVVPTAAYRGAGRPEATYAIERLIDVAARELGIDPYELRRRNLIPPEAMPFRTALTFTYDCGEFEANMRMAAEAASLADFPRRRAAAAAHRRLRGIGLCNCIEASGGPFLRPLRDAAKLRLEPDGTVSLHTGALSTGQGLETALSRLVAERLGVPIELVRYRQGDTDHMAYGRGQGGSSALVVGGTAIGFATDRLIETARRLAGDRMEVAPEDVVFADGRFTVAGTDRFVTLAALAETVGPIEEAAEFQPAVVTFPNGTHIAEIEIDPETGENRLVGYWAVEDIGRVMNPVLAHGQIHGGIAQGVGQALGEQIVHEPGSGQVLTASFMDYRMPRASDFPDFHLAMREVPTAANPLGVKGVGEAGTVGSLAAVMNAVCDALAPLGIRHFDMPATPQRIWAAIAAAREGVFFF